MLDEYINITPFYIKEDYNIIFFIRQSKMINKIANKKCQSDGWSLGRKVLFAIKLIKFES